MPIPVSRDSISKCSQSNDIFALVRNPTLKMTAQPPQVDSIKSMQGQMEREATAKLFKMLQASIVVARAGKFIFLALAVPPYVLLYSLPKWLIIDLMPKLLFQFFNPMKGIGDKMKNLFKTDNEKGLINHLRNVLNGISTQATEYLKWIDKASKALFVHLKHQTVAMAYRLLNPLMPTFQKSLDAAETITKMLLQKTYEKGDKQIELARQFVSFAWKIAKQEFANQIRPFTEMIKSKFNEFRKEIRTLLERPRLEIQKLKAAVSKKLKRAEEVLESAGLKISKNIALAAATITYMAKPMIAWASPSIQWSAETLQAGRERFMRGFEIARGFIQNLASGVMDAARLSRQVVITQVKNIFEIAIPSFVKHFFNPEGGFKKQAQQWAENLSKKLKKFKNSVIQNSRDGIRAFKRELFGFLHKIQQFFVYLGFQIKQLPSRIKKAAVKSYHFSIYSYGQLGQFFRWIGVWSRVLWRLAWQELRDHTLFESWKNK